MTELPISVFRVNTAEGAKDYVHCLGHEQVFARGLAPEGIIGVLLRQLEPAKPSRTLSLSRIAYS